MTRARRRRGRLARWRSFQGPFGRASTMRGTCLLMRVQSAAVGRASFAAWAMAGTWSRRFVEPPMAAVNDHRVVDRSVGEDITCAHVELAHAKDGRGRSGGAASSQMGWPEGPRAE